jgi:hypothetical protein
LYIPEGYCGISGNCSTSYGASRRTLWALTSSDLPKAIVGRFLVGLTFLRSFGLARHWKQMWLNHTYEGGDRERCKFALRCFILVKDCTNAHQIVIAVVRQLLFVEKVETSRNRFRRKKSDVRLSVLSFTKLKQHNIELTTTFFLREGTELCCHTWK